MFFGLGFSVYIFRSKFLLFMSEFNSEAVTGGEIGSRQNRFPRLFRRKLVEKIPILFFVAPKPKKLRTVGLPEKKFVGRSNLM